MANPPDCTIVDIWIGRNTPDGDDTSGRVGTKKIFGRCIQLKPAVFEFRNKAVEELKSFCSRGHREIADELDICLNERPDEYSG